MNSVPLKKFRTRAWVKVHGAWKPMGPRTDVEISVDAARLNFVEVYQDIKNDWRCGDEVQGFVAITEEVK